MLFAAATQPGATRIRLWRCHAWHAERDDDRLARIYLATLITVFAGAAGALVYLIGLQIVRRRYRWFMPLPYGPYIVIGTLIMLLFRDQVQDLLMNGLTRRPPEIPHLTYIAIRQFAHASGERCCIVGVLVARLTTDEADGN